MMRSRFVSALLILSLLPNLALAQQTRTPPSTLRLTGEQWSCLQTRLPNLRRSSSDTVRVPLSACNQGANVRGPGAGNVTAGQPRRRAPTDPTLTRSPLYLTKSQLSCIETQLPQLTSAEGVSEVDLTRCP